MEKEEVIKGLIKKYNDVLLNSMSIALAEDLINLIVVNGEDNNFEVLDFVKDKTKFRAFVTNEFLKLNSGSVLNELKTMEDAFESKMTTKKNLKSGVKKLF